MVTKVYWISASTPGKIGIMPRPRGGEQLVEEIQALRKADVQTVVSLLTDVETFELELPLEAEECSNHQIEFLAFPMRDRQVPPLDYTTLRFLQMLADRLSQGHNVVVHCRMGVGRAALIAASTLALCGIEPGEAFAVISKARGCQVPDTAEQRQWVSRFARTHRTLKPTTDLWTVTDEGD